MEAISIEDIVKRAVSEYLRQDAASSAESQRLRVELEYLDRRAEVLKAQVKAMLEDVGQGGCPVFVLRADRPADLRALIILGGYCPDSYLPVVNAKIREFERWIDERRDGGVEAPEGLGGGGRG